jgi:hypothetical protein
MEGNFIYVIVFKFVYSSLGFQLKLLQAEIYVKVLNWKYEITNINNCKNESH